MKIFITLFFLITADIASAQWSDTNNRFYDSLHTPVSNALKSQQHPLVLQSFPDSGYFVIWEDARNDPANFKSAIYAQKYDKTGNALWAANGIPVNSSSNRQHYTYSSSNDYRNYNYAATDSAGGFYITYSDDSVSNYVWERVCVQHVLTNGNPVFAGAGKVLSTSPSANLNMTPQLIPDDNRGFFISYRNNAAQVFMYCFRDESGTLHNYGGGLMNENAVETITSTPCGNHTTVNYPDVNVNEYKIFTDLQGGCNIAMYLSGNGAQGHMIAYNKLFRAKKNSASTQYHLDDQYNSVSSTTNYSAGNVYRLWYVSTDYQTITCGTNPVYVFTQFRLLQNGYQLIDDNSNVVDYGFVKGTTISTDGNINVSFFAADKRVFNPSVSSPVVQAISLNEEKYDSIPYQRASDNNSNIGYNTISPPLNKLNIFRDTILPQAVYPYDYCLAGGANQILAGGLLYEAGSGSNQSVRLQRLAVERQNTDSFAVVYKTSKKGGELMAKDFGDSYTPQYDFPVLSVNKNGTGFFQIRDNQASVARISPILNGVQLAWGAMGRQVGTGVYDNSSYYSGEQAQIAFDPGNNKGMIAWSDSRNIPSSSAPNIYMRHLDSLFSLNYYPPYKRVRIMSNPYTATSSTKFSMYGNSHRYTLLEAYCAYGNDPGVSPVADIKDNYYFGQITARVFQTNTTRTYSGKAYLNRNFTIYADSIPPNANSINIRLLFTKIEFDALKVGDNSLLTPADLIVIRQPHNSSDYPTEYAPVAGEQTLTPIAWDSVPGGYYLEVKAGGLGDFFIQKTSLAQLCPGGNTSIVSSLTGSSYQWQVNTGSGFTNLTNNVNYVGVNTSTLQLNSIPSGWAAYQYRCVVNGNNSAVTSLRFVTSWSGNINTDWNNAGNWNCGSIPDANTDVILTSGTVVVNSTAACRTISINPAVSFSVLAGFTLTVAH
ncbi:MAG: hypothetical protein ABJA78_01350 [Ferruginibacter sp.]